MQFSYQQKVLFKHCDPAGIAFFPRICEMINDAVEALFCECLNWPFENLHKSQGVPTVALNIQFNAPCRHGDQLVLQVSVRNVGNASLTLNTRSVCNDELRFGADQTLVLTDADGQPTNWPIPVKSKLLEMMENVT